MVIILVTKIVLQPTLVWAEGPGIVQEAIMAALKGVGAQITGKELQKDISGKQYCEYRYTLTDFRGMKGMDLLVDITGYTQVQLYKNGVRGMLRSGDAGELYTFSFHLPPEFCIPPSGTSPATNPVLDLDDDSLDFLKGLALIILAAFGLGSILIQPRTSYA